MQKILLMLSSLLTIVFVYSQTPDTWTEKADFGGNSRHDAVGFSINNKGYIGTGIDFNGQYKNDFWEYDPVTNTWSQKADFGGGGRWQAVGFSIAGKGYLGTGDFVGFEPINDFWEYDPVANVWTKKANFGGSSRDQAVGFSIGIKGYIGTGYDVFGHYQNDFWEYDPVANVWAQKANFGGDGRYGAVGFSIGSKGYVGTGFSFNGQRTYSYKDFWEYDPSADKWTKKADFGGLRSEAVGFSIGSKGYIGTGSAKGAVKNDFWQYDPAADRWTKKADCSGNARYSAVGFSIGSKGYIGTGYGFNGQTFFLYKDFWEYTPSVDTVATGCQLPSNLKVQSISDTSAVLEWILPLNPVNSFDVLYHIIGSTRIHKRHAAGSTNHITVGDLLSNTTYRWQMRSDCTTDTTSWVSGPDFTTTTSAVSLNAAAAKANNVSVQIMPNPNNGNFTIQMQLPVKAALTTLTVYNSFGIKVWQQNAGMLSNSVSRNIELKSKLPDVYTLIIQYGDTQLMQKVVVTK